jgi:putative nucleotidyltransferase with HDIG domain
MTSSTTKVYVAAVCALAALALATEPWIEVSRLETRDQWGLVALIALGLLSESLSLRTASEGSEGTFTITLVPLLASVLIFGPAPTILFMGISGAVAEFFYHRKPVLKASFNVGQYIVAAGLAGWTYSTLNGLALITPSMEGSAVIILSAKAFVAYGIVFLAVNHFLVAGVITLSRRASVRAVLRSLFGKWGSNIAYDLMVSPIAIAVAILYEELYIFGLLTALLPLLFIRHSYHLNYRIIRANQDLLNALVKAIETRDPYTSGHSLRVASLASLISSQLGLKPSRVDLIKQAALLHDIGKIDAIYADILRKPDGLSRQERTVIESHVTKGVELLETLSSVPDTVIRDVRHHHERVDGRGYPEGLVGDEIPLGARIIKVCDAIDAMLSDRPYRAALDLATTRRELVRFSGTQFDPRIVRIIVDSHLLEQHALRVNDWSTEPLAGSQRLGVEAPSAEAANPSPKPTPLLHPGVGVPSHSVSSDGTVRALGLDGQVPSNLHSRQQTS